MFLNLIIKTITETIAGGINSAEIDKRIRFLMREDSLQREIAITNTKSMTPSYEKLADTHLATECDDDAGATLTVLEKIPPKV